MLTSAQRARFADALNRMGGDVNVLTAMAKMVIEDAPSLMTEIEDHLSAGRLSEAAASGHTLMGSLSTFQSGPSSPTELQAMINDARSGDRAGAIAHWHESRPAVDRLIQEISQLRSDD